MTIRPLHDRILVRRDEADRMTRGGIVLPESTQKDRPQKGTVLAVGPGRRVLAAIGTFHPEPVCVMPGDEVLFTKFAGEGIKIDGQEYFLVRNEDLIAVIEPDPDPADGQLEIYQDGELVGMMAADA